LGVGGCFFPGSDGIKILSQVSMPIFFFFMAAMFITGVIQVANGKPKGSMYCKFLDPDGDVTIGISTVNGPEGTWEFVHGTGKWEGVSGGGKNWPITKGKAIAPGTFQGCRKATGTYQLPQ
jgi:hypothetical protein